MDSAMPAACPTLPPVTGNADNPSAGGLEKCRVTDRQICTPEGFRWLDLVRLEYHDPQSRAFAWEAVERRSRPEGTDCDGVAVLAKVVSRSRPTRVPVVVQFRPPMGCLVVELPAGLVEPGQSLAETAERELKEETGYVGRVVSVSPLAAECPGLTSSSCKLAVAEVDGDAPENVDPRASPEAGEALRCELLPYEGLLPALLALCERYSGSSSGSVGDSNGGACEGGYSNPASEVGACGSSAAGGGTGSSAGGQGGERGSTAGAAGSSSAGVCCGGGDATSAAAEGRTEVRAGRSSGVLRCIPDAKLYSFAMGLELARAEGAADRAAAAAGARVGDAVGGGRTGTAAAAASAWWGAAGEGCAAGQRAAVHHPVDAGTSGGAGGGGEERGVGRERSVTDEAGARAKGQLEQGRAGSGGDGGAAGGGGAAGAGPREHPSPAADWRAAFLAQLPGLDEHEIQELMRDERGDALDEMLVRRPCAAGSDPEDLDDDADGADPYDRELGALAELASHMLTAAIAGVPWGGDGLGSEAAREEGAPEEDDWMWQRRADEPAPHGVLIEELDEDGAAMAIEAEEEEEAEEEQEGTRRAGVWAGGAGGVQAAGGSGGGGEGWVRGGSRGAPAGSVGQGAQGFQVDPAMAMLMAAAGLAVPQPAPVPGAAGRTPGQPWAPRGREVARQQGGPQRQGEQRQGGPAADTAGQASTSGAPGASWRQQHRGGAGDGDGGGGGGGGWGGRGGGEEGGEEGGGRGGRGRRGRYKKGRRGWGRGGGGRGGGRGGLDGLGDLVPRRPRSTVGGGGSKRGFAGGNAGPLRRPGDPFAPTAGRELAALVKGTRALMSLRGWRDWAARDPVALGCGAVLAACAASVGVLAVRVYLRP